MPKTKILYGIFAAVLTHLKSDSHSGVLIRPDDFGLCLAMRDIAKRIAAEGYSVLVANPFTALPKVRLHNHAADSVGESGRRR